jgi:hypothetical protein
MMQMFHHDFAKVDLGVAHVAMAKYVLSVSSISNVCCKCFIWMFQN